MFCMKCGKNIGDLKECPYCAATSTDTVKTPSPDVSAHGESSVSQERTQAGQPRAKTEMPPAVEKFAGAAGKTIEGVLGKAREKINAASAFADKKLLEKNITRDKRLAFASLLLGIMAILCVFSLSRASGVILAEIGIVTGIAGQKQKACKKFALGGICCGAAAIVLAILPRLMK